MCGIVGVYAFKKEVTNFNTHIEQAINLLSKRGPDSHGQFIHRQVGLGHARLSIIDTSDFASQPMHDITGRYVIVYNGEIYNFKELRLHLTKKDVKFNSDSDTEVLLNLYIEEGPDFLEMVNGFFAFAIYDKIENTLFIARDRLGIKPLLIYQDEEKIILASEMKAIMAFPIIKTLDFSSLHFYLQLNYIPAPSTVFKHVKKVKAGSYLIIKENNITENTFYTIPKPISHAVNVPTYSQAKIKLHEMLEGSVKKRLISDVPLGAFLSGGIDSSIIVALASRFTNKLNTFSIGYADEPYFDETKYAHLVSKKFNTNHTTFSLTNSDLYKHLFDILDYIDEPFGDSSAIAVYILSKHTRQKVTVALSGDGADELLAGYNKHLAEYKARKNNILNWIIKLNQPLLNYLPKSRNTSIGNLFRQLHRFAEGLSLSHSDRYWRWCAFVNEDDSLKMFNHTVRNSQFNTLDYLDRKKDILKYLNETESLNDNLYADVHLVLQNDMLTKVDMMSMANSLEVRVPFLDHELVEYLFQLPVDYKIGKGFRKKILKDTFKEILPHELYSRPKHGFEVPLLKWFRNELKDLIDKDLLSDKFIEEQGIFDVGRIQFLKNKLFSNNPEEVHAQIWGLIVFQYWWKKYIN